jgi:uncharacterized protein YjbI with pentapeptide repeats
VLDGTNKHPVDLRGATVESISAERGTVRLPFRLDGATVGGLSLEGAHVTQDLTLDDATVTGPVDTFEVQFDGDISCVGTTFEAPVELDEGRFEDDSSFDGAEFREGFAARTAEFRGESRLLDDSTSFTDVRFEGEVDCRHTDFGYAQFNGATFAGDATFEEAAFGDDVEFDGATFEGELDCDEVRFGGDASFTGVTMAGLAHFRGALFEGGTRMLEADAAFQGVTFASEADFRRAVFRVAEFTESTFEDEVTFEEAVFEDDADFVDCAFDALADFDEVLFDGDTDFSGATFAADADFRGAEFRGAANHLAEGVSFDDARFEATADFDDATFTSASFVGTAFGGETDFTGAVFTDSLVCQASVTSAATYLDFTEAKVKRGRIVQPETGWVHYDMTRASLGDVTLDAAREADRRELLDYFRFCETEFDEFDGLAFDFSDHADYLDRNGWVLHGFDERLDADYDYALELTPAVTETTYLKAKTAASSAGDMKAAGEFRVKRQAWARRKHLDIARDASVALGSRVRNGLRALENGFLGLTCGHGMRLFRIAAVFVLAPLLFVVPYAFGGDLFLTGAGQLDSLAALATPEGQEIFYKNVHFSYISYTTIGYGNIGPKGAIARIMAGGEAYLSTLLAALVVYALVKRSEL